MSFLYVFLGGGLGAVLRHGVGLVVPGPYGTWVVNVLGSLGLAYLTARGVSEPWKLAVGTGLFGGFTTYSTFNQDTIRQLQAGDFAAAALNVGATVVLCLGSGALGMWLGRQ